MNLNQATSSGRPRTARKRVGRGQGSGLGKTSGRGHKGAQSRTGYSRVVQKEGGQMPLFRRLPKRGFNNFEFRVEHAEVNIAALDAFDAGATVGPEELRARKLARGDGPIKVLGNGTIDKALTVRAHKFSKAAVSKIEAAGGRAEVI